MKQLSPEQEHRIVDARNTVVVASQREEFIDKLISNWKEKKNAFSSGEPEGIIKSMRWMIGQLHEQLIGVVETIDELTIPGDIIEETQTQKDAISKHL